MKKILLTIAIVLIAITAIAFAEIKPEVIYTDGVMTIACIDGYEYMVVVHQGGASVIQIEINKDGKIQKKECQCQKEKTL